MHNPTAALGENRKLTPFNGEVRDGRKRLHSGWSLGEAFFVGGGWERERER
jgi:hypothetical protein